MRNLSALRGAAVLLVAVALVAAAVVSATSSETRERVAIALGNGEMEYAPIDPDSPKEPQPATRAQIQFLGSTNIDLRKVRSTPAPEKRPSREMGAPQQPLGGGSDNAVQTYFGTKTATPAPTAFDGMSLMANGSGWPPDTTGAIGPSHFVQAVNSSVAFFTRDGSAASVTGTNLKATMTFNAFFQTGATNNSPCYGNNQGDPLVLYNRLDSNWIVSDFAWGSGTGYYQCIAVSKGPDPITDGWNFYALLTSSKALNDYPKMGIWHNGLWLTANMFTNGRSYSNAQVWVINRSDLKNESGNVRTPRAFTWNMGSSQFSLVPANLSDLASTADETNWTSRPQYVLSSYNTTKLKLWTFKASINWDATTVDLPIPYTVDGVEAYVKASGRVPQASPGEGLDALGDRLMYPVQFRNGSLFAAHTVSPSSGRYAIRWWQIGTLPTTASATVPSVTQQGTFMPDSQQRWMPSIAVNKNGDIALIYSTSSSTTKPSIRMTGRLGGTTSTLPGILDVAETTLQSSGGVQKGGYNRWGDYSMAVVDPEDHCTFWYTTEYYKATGYDWQTRWGSFKLSSCP